FVNRIANPAITLEALLQDPAETALAMPIPGVPHELIAAPPDLFAPARRNAAGLDLSDEHVLAMFASQLSARLPAPAITEAMRDDVDRAFAHASNQLPPALRAACLMKAADLLERHHAGLIAILVTEAGKTLPNAISEIREAVDFLRYYATEITEWDQSYAPLGTVICISPWNFPLAIFLGQAAAAFAAGNAVIAKPAEETPRIAAFAHSLLHQAGIPASAFIVLQGDGTLGAALVSHPSCDGVVFTGSTAVARLIQSSLADRVSHTGQPIPLIAETGGINAMIVDSSALPEQVVADALYSAFDSAGQRCSALRLLCVQEDAAPRLLPMLREAMAELSLGPPDRLATDIGPVITAQSADTIRAHIAALRASGARVTHYPGAETERLVAPAIIEIDEIAQLSGEVFGPVLHVITYPRAGLDRLIDEINAKGYALTFGLHTRIDAFAAYVASRIAAGNIYINRNMVGAVVGVQPFGGHGLSGTGPKAGGPLYLYRLLAAAPACLPTAQTLPGPVGEHNAYALQPRGAVYCQAITEAGARAQAEAVAAAGCQAVFTLDEPAAALLEGDAAAVKHLARALAARTGPIIPLFALTPAAIAAGAAYNPVWLMAERVVTTNTTAAGGNASLMAL
ncbi:MAG: L-glutamate gamma-semialdehyde dehydrogenase, partial [Acidocella sp.]|nr:L-glutamate gamma-semialdehyde dehydrogenase [Acidocella sp.]